MLFSFSFIFILLPNVLLSISFPPFSPHSLLLPTTLLNTILPIFTGKSNVMDAISFVLGVKSTTLRGNKLGDLIHKKPDENSSNRKAFVEVVYIDDEDEDDNTEIHFRRTITASGGSGYYLDGKKATWEQYNAKLMDIGVLVRARNFLVFQGDVDSVASKSPAELTQLIEEISGSGDLREEYDELKVAYEKAEEVVHRTFDKRKNVLREEKQIREQKEEAEHFQELLEEQQRLKTEFFLWQLFHVEKDLAFQTEELQDLTEQLAAEQERLAAAEGAIKKLSGSGASTRKAFLNAEKESTKLRRLMAKKQPLIIKLAEQIEHLSNTLKEQEKEKKKLEKAATKHQKEVDALEAELEEVAQAEKEFLEAAESEEKEKLELASAQLEEYNRIREEAGAKTTPLRQELESLSRELRSKKEMLTNIETQLSTLHAQKDQLTPHMAGLIERKSRMEKFVSEAEEKLETQRKEVAELETRTARDAKRREKVTQSLQAVQLRLHDAKADMRENEREGRMMECLDTLKRLFPGVRGRVIDLCKPQQVKYHTAVTVAMGNKNMEAIVCDDEKTALECVQYMKEQRIGTATFIPLDTIKVKPPPEALRHIGGSFKPVIDVLEYEEVNAKAMLYVCGTALVCDTMDEARQYAYRRQRGENEQRSKVVTLDGSVIHKNGNMAGGVASSARSDRWDEKAMQKARKMRDDYLAELQDLDASRRDTDSLSLKQTQINGLENRIKYSKIDLQVTLEKIAETKEKDEALQADIASRAPNQKTLADEVARLSQSVEEKKQSIAREEDKLFGAFSKKIGVKNIREYEESRAQLVEAHTEQKLALRERYSRLENQVKYEKKRDLLKPVRQLESKMKKDSKKLEQAQADHAKSSASLVEQEEELANLVKQCEEAKASMETSQDELKALKKDAGDVRKALNQVEKSITATEGKVEQLRTIRAEIFRRCTLEQVDLPRLSVGNKKKNLKNIKKKGGQKRRKKSAAGGGRHRAGRKKRKSLVDSDDEEGEEEETDEEKVASSEEENGKEEADASDDEEEVDGEEEDEGEEEGEVDFTSLTRNRQIKNQQHYEQIKQTYMEQSAKMASEIETLAPNLKAIEYFAEVKDKLKNTDTDFEEKKKEAKAVNAKFEEVRRKRHELFMRAFEHISECIDGIYKDLTRSQSFPLGGTAYLSLENSDDPFLSGIKYTAMPPLKRFRDMEQLSGGEKAVAALALLFAIHSYHPAPFFVLDEVDANLDNVNVNKVSNYIRARAHDSGLQCIVISLKDTFYGKADGLVGVYRDVPEQSSGVLTLDMEQYPVEASE